MNELDDPNMDPRVKQYLDKLRMGSQDASADQTAIDAHNAQVSNSLLASLGKSASMMGTVGGKQADNSGLENMANSLNQSQRDISQRQANTAQSRQENTMKVYEYLANKAQQEASAKKKKEDDIASEDRAFERQKKLKGMEIAGQKDMYSLKTPQSEVAFNALPKEQQRMVTDLAAKNASKQSVANQIRSGLKEFQMAKTEDDRVRIGRQMLKTVNSAEGADAIGVEEANRLGGALEYQMFNITGPGPAFGRDLPGFEKQVAAAIKSIESGVDANNQVIADMYSGKSPDRSPVSTVMDMPDMSGTATAAPGPSVPTAKDQQALQWLLANPTAPQSQKIRDQLKAKGLIPGGK